MKSMSAPYFGKYDPRKKYNENTCQTNIKGSKMI